MWEKPWFLEVNAFSIVIALILFWDITSMESGVEMLIGSEGEEKALRRRVAAGLA